MSVIAAGMVALATRVTRRFPPLANVASSSMHLSVVKTT